MIRRIGSGMALCVYAAVGLAAAGVWETKPFTEWTDNRESRIAHRESKRRVRRP